jgi:hypothetical protein
MWPAAGGGDERVGVVKLRFSKAELAAAAAELPPGSLGQKSARFLPGAGAMPSAAQQRWLLRIAAAAALVGGCAAATASLLSSESHFAALPLRFAAEAWLASGNLTSDLLSSAGGGGAGCGNAPPAAL